MTRTETHLDAVLRHLGAAYYGSLQGRATPADVARATDHVTRQLNEQAVPEGEPAAAGLAGARPHGVSRSPGGWSRRVSDVMTTPVVSVGRGASYKEIAALMANQGVSGLPVLKANREVAGVVTEADLLAGQRQAAQRLRAPGARRPWARRRGQPPALTAGELMTVPAITIGPQASVPAAVRLMDSRHVRLLPVVDQHNHLVGVVSRRDLLTVFLRPDEVVAADVRRVLDHILLAKPGEAEVTVNDGVVTLTGTLDPHAGAHGDLIPVAVRLMWDVDGVVDVIDHLGQPQVVTGDRAAPPAQAG